MHLLKKSALSIVFICALITNIFTVHAGDLVYTPQNPSFGGSVAYGNYLLGQANAQKQFEKEREEDSNLQKFNDRLQSSILSRITSAVTRDIVDIDGNITPGFFETVDYTIDIHDNGDGTVTITTTDKDSGDTTVVSVKNDL